MSVFSRGILALAAIVALGAAPIVRADTATIFPSSDNSLFESDPGASCGQGPLFVGETRFAGSRRALLLFDIAGSIPAGSTIDAVVLTLECDGSGPSASPTDVLTLHRLAASWGEQASSCQLGLGVEALPGDATWSERFYAQGSSWNALGGDFDATASGSTAVPLVGTTTWSSQPGLVADVQSWLDAAATNHGWIVIGEESTPGSARDFDSREGAAPPRLDVAFTAPSSTPPEVPDGRHAPPVRVSKLTPDGASLLVEFDTALCSGDPGHHIVYGTRSGFPSELAGTYVPSGSACAIGPTSPFAWIGAPDPTVLDPVNRMLWFLVIADDALVTEGAWGTNSALLERQGPGPGGSSGQCGITGKSLANTCGRAP